MKTYTIKTNHSDFSLLSCIASQVQDIDPEIKHTCNFAAKTVQKLSTILFILMRFSLSFLAQTIWSLVLLC